VREGGLRREQEVQGSDLCDNRRGGESGKYRVAVLHLVYYDLVLICL
jgi:hypothetical protein